MNYINKMQRDVEWGVSGRDIYHKTQRFDQLMEKIRNIYPEANLYYIDEFGLRFKTDMWETYKVFKDKNANYVLETPTVRICSFALSPLPGNHHITVSHNVYTMPDHRNKGIGNLMNLIRIEMCEEAGTQLLATVSYSNDTQGKIMQKNGWKPVHAYRGTLTQLYIHDVPGNALNDK